jgi:hypothetical protein
MDRNTAVAEVGPILESSRLETKAKKPFIIPDRPKILIKTDANELLEMERGVV